MVHKYQHFFDSDTWISMNRDRDIDPVTDGFERAVKIKALEDFEHKGFRGLDWEQLHDMRAASTAINGYAQALEEISDVNISDMQELGLTDKKADEALDSVGSDRNKGYDVVAASLLAQEKSSGLQIYREVFKEGSESDAVPEFAL